MFVQRKSWFWHEFSKGIRLNWRLLLNGKRGDNIWYLASKSGKLNLIFYGMDNIYICDMEEAEEDTEKED